MSVAWLALTPVAAWLGYFSAGHGGQSGIPGASGALNG